MYLIVGLGNPGLKYRNTRHNVGFTAIDALAKEHGLRFTKKRFRGVTAEGTIGGEKVILLKPHTYMNLSGDAVAEAAKFYHLEPEKIIVFLRARKNAGLENMALKFPRPTKSQFMIGVPIRYSIKAKYQPIKGMYLKAKT